jgi:3-methylfumaryl-CoA hydratase
VEAAWRREVMPDPVLLFRFSALTFNSHRIHFDGRYATRVEGYPGMVVHGPLLATLLVDLLRRERPAATLTRFRFRAVSPLFDVESFRVCGQVARPGLVTLWVANVRGGLAMAADAEISE